MIAPVNLPLLIIGYILTVVGFSMSSYRRGYQRAMKDCQILTLEAQL